MHDKFHSVTKWNNTTSDLSLNAFRPEHLNAKPHPQPKDVVPVQKFWRTDEPFVKSIQRENHTISATMPTTDNRARNCQRQYWPTNKNPTQVSNCQNIGYCTGKAARVAKAQAHNKRLWEEAAHEAAVNITSRPLVHSEAHNYRFQYSHTLGRMKAYEAMRLENETREYAKMAEIKKLAAPSKVGREPFSNKLSSYH